MGKGRSEPKWQRVAKDVWFALVLLGITVYAGWLLVDDLASYAYQPARAITQQLSFDSRSTKKGDLIVVAYTYAVEGKTYTGNALFGPAADERAHYFAKKSFQAWHDEWAKDPVVYYDPKAPERSRMVVGLTSSLSVVFVPAVLVLGVFGYTMVRRPLKRMKHDVYGALYRMKVGFFGVVPFLACGLVGQAIYFTPLWVEQGWILHLLTTLATAGGLALGLYLAGDELRYDDEMEVELARLNEKVGREIARRGVGR